MTTYKKEVRNFDPKVGDLVCDCRMKHLKIVARDNDILVLEDGTHASLYHCCNPPDHAWSHADVIEEATKQLGNS